MPKKSTRERSKRVSLKQKYKAIKKVKDHHRKLRRAAKKGGIVKRKKKVRVASPRHPPRPPPSPAPAGGCGGRGD